MIAGVRRGHNTFLYYVEEISKRAVIRCIVVDSSGTYIITIMNIDWWRAKSGLITEDIYISGLTYAFYQRNKSNVLEIFKFEK